MCVFGHFFRLTGIGKVFNIPIAWVRGLRSNGTVNAVKQSFKVANNKSTIYSIPSGKRIDGHSWTGPRQIVCMLR